MKYEIFGIGSVLMDFLVEVDDKELVEIELKKGHFHLIDEKRSKLLLERIKKYKIRTAPGGSCANTLYGAAILGSSVVFCGKIGNDKHGNVYEEKMLSNGVKTNLTKSEKITGHAITFITPDTERTFAVHLGACLELKKEDIFFEDLKESKIIHIEGYQLEDKNLRNVSLHAMEFAKKNNVKISIDLGDPGIVKRNKDDILNIVKDYADIIFANEEEAIALTGLEPRDALDKISKFVEITIVKIGKGGSYIKKDNKIYQIPCYKAKAIDTTGAGDMFAAGVLFGISKDYDLKTCGHIGAYYSAKVVEKIGARLDNIDKEELKKMIENVNK